MDRDKSSPQLLVLPNFTLSDYGSFFAAGGLGAMCVVLFWVCQNFKLTIDIQVKPRSCHA